MPTGSKPITIGALRVDSSLLAENNVARCRVEECRATCCGHGVYVDLAQASQIMEEADLIKPYLPPQRRDPDQWFDGEAVEDSDFPSGYRVGTEVLEDPRHAAGTRCVFLRPDNRCGIQAAAVANGRHPWDLKPFYCALFPVVVSDGVVSLDQENDIYRLGGTCQRAALASVPLYVLFKEELVLALGQDGYDQLSSIASNHAGVDR